MVYFYSSVVYRNGEEVDRIDGLSGRTEIKKRYCDLDSFMKALKEEILELYMKKHNIEDPSGYDVVFVAFNPMF